MIGDDRGQSETVGGQSKVFGDYWRVSKTVGDDRRDHVVSIPPISRAFRGIFQSLPSAANKTVALPLKGDGPDCGRAFSLLAGYY